MRNNLNETAACLPQLAVYSGSLTHRRVLSPMHAFHYRMRVLWWDVDSAALDQHAGWASTGADKKAWVFARVRRADYLPGPCPTLADAARALLRETLPDVNALRIFLLTTPRVFGIAFNPLSLYYVYDCAAPDDGSAPVAVIAEVRNTPWMERQVYVVDLRAAHRSHEKTFHVSPFLPMGLRYQWQLPAPAAELAVGIGVFRDGTEVFRARWHLQREAFSPARELWRHWPQGLKTVIGIYAQAVKMILRRARFYGHPSQHATYAQAEGVSENGKKTIKSEAS